jgi:hypothetical protein
MNSGACALSVGDLIDEQPLSRFQIRTFAADFWRRPVINAMDAAQWTPRQIFLAASLPAL